MCSVPPMTLPVEPVTQEVREVLGMTQRQFARAAGIDHTYLSRYERGQVQPTRHWLRRVNRAIGQLVAQRFEEIHS
jgi:transcriptional regulator with XRE-family HTH domain